MRQVVTTFIVCGLVMAGSLSAQQKPQEMALQAAMRAETVSGDLKSAIAQYQQIVERYAKADRAVAATALVRMAECHHKLGEQQAARLFERVLRDFGDQKEAVQIASARLGRAKAVAASAGMVNRQVWTGRSVDYLGTLSADGRTHSFVDWETGDLAIREVASGTTRRLTDKGTWADSDDFAESSAISRDGAQVAYAWFDAKTSRYHLRTAKTDGSEANPPRTLYENPDVTWLAPYDWSPDGRLIAVAVQRADRTGQIGIVNVREGSYRTLTSVDWRGPTRMSFSADGSFVAYDLPQSEEEHARDVFVLSADGTRQSRVATHPSHDLVVGWSPDGRNLFFSSDRSGSMGLWSVPMANGQPSGVATLVKADIGRVVASLGVSSTGALLYAIKTSAMTVGFATLDVERARLAHPTFPFESYLMSVNQPDWSADGQTIVALAEQSRGRFGLTIRTPDGRTLRELSVPLGYLGRPRWAPDGSITVQGRDFKGRRGFFRVDQQTGEATPLVVRDDGSTIIGQASWLPNGESLVFRELLADKNRVIHRNVSTGEERILAEHASIIGLSVAPDGERVAFVARDRESQTAVITTTRVEDAHSVEVARLPLGAELGNVTVWTRDGGHLLFARKEKQQASLWMVPATGGTPRKIESELDNPLTAISLRLHPDGRTVTFGAGESSHELWILENFLPAASTTTSRR